MAEFGKGKSKHLITGEVRGKEVINGVRFVSIEVKQMDDAKSGVRTSHLL